MFSDIYSSDFAIMCSKDESILDTDETVLEYAATSLEQLTEQVNNILFKWAV